MLKKGGIFKMKKILAIGSHYDDIEIGCAGTILKHFQRGDKIWYAITHTDEYRTGAPGYRLSEQHEAANVIGINRRFIYLLGETDSDSQMIECLDPIKPDIIFAPFEHDTHQHHRRSSVIAQAVGRKRHITMLFYDSGSTYDFHPNVFSVVDFNKKLEILNCFASQINCGAINIDIVKKKNAYWASLITDEPDVYAEGFVARKLKWEL
jgi:LmbE family N-acetylglucosaminyl deacetylase